MLQPGEQATQIVLWDVDDPGKQGDPRFWWPTEHPLELPDGRPRTGPKGTSLAALRERSDGDEIELVVPTARLRRAAEGARKIRVATAEWADADPERTYVLVSHHYRPTAEESAAEKARRGGESPFPADAESVRQEWLAALEAGDADRAAGLKTRLDELLAARGWSKPVAQADDGVEIQPGVYLLDVRPQSGA